MQKALFAKAVSWPKDTPDLITTSAMAARPATAATAERAAKAAEAAGLRIDINAPTAKAPSMTMALEQYITG